MSAQLAATVAALRRLGPSLPGLADRLERSGPDALLTAAVASDAPSLFAPEDPGPLRCAAERDLAAWEKRGLRVITVLDGEYPANLRTVHDRPAAIVLAGDPGRLVARAIAVVGTRQPTPSGCDHAAQLAAALVGLGITVISGLAAGIDTAAHRAALEAGGSTVAVIGTGHDHAYPRQNTALQTELASRHAVLSPFWPEIPPSADGFRHRNGVMSGLSRGTVIVEASPRSGTRVQARRALAHGRPVFLLPALLAQPWAQELAARPGVHVVQTAAEIAAITDRLAQPMPPEA